MHFLGSERSRQRRSDPLLILPECRSILVVGMRYPTPLPKRLKTSNHAHPGNPVGRIAAYAQIADYHNWIPDRLEKIVTFLAKEYGRQFPYRIYTDTGPLLERDLAQRAGLGWIGKNTCLIHPRLGSYFFLAEALLGIELEPDPPFESDRCGACRRCIQACPTMCILPNRTLDARRCISYLTIELKGAIPPSLRASISNWIFGCDVCQQVCPWNERFAAPFDLSAPDMASQDGKSTLVALPDLAEILQLAPEEFNQRYKGFPVQRARRRGFLRNAAVALGNSGHPLAINGLQAALLNDPEPLVRSHAAWGLGQLVAPQARQALLSAWQSEKDPEVIMEIEAALRSLTMES